MGKGKSRGRRIKFALLRYVVFPVAAPLFLLWRWTWRVQFISDVPVADVLKEPRIIVATFHGMLLPLVGGSNITREHGRELVVMVSPSKDGDLFANLLDRLGVKWVRGSSKSRAVAAAREFVRHYEEGLIGMIAVDGPRGPCCEERSGILRMADLTGARILLVAGAMSRGLTLRSWDRAQVPAPFAKVQIAGRFFQPLADAEEDTQRAELRRQLISLSHEIGSRVVPPLEVKSP